MRKIVAMILAAMMLLTSAAALAEVNEYGWDVPAEPLEFSAFFAEQYASQEEFEEERAKYDFIMDKFLKDKFNVVINKTQSLEETSEWVNLAVLNGEYPDVVTWLPNIAAETLIDGEVAIPLDELLEKYGQNIVNEVGSYLELCRDEDGHIYKLPVAYGFAIDQVGYAFSIRYDWWLELKNAGQVEAYPATPEEWYEQMKMMLANHPTNEKGEKVYAVTAADKNGQNLLNTLLGAWGFYSGYDVDAENNLTYWPFTDRAADLCKFANKLWREGMIHPDFLSFTYDDAQANAVDDRLAGNISTWWYMFTWGHEYWQEIDPATPLEKRFVNLAVTADGVEHQTMANKGYLANAYLVITDACKNPEAVMSWLDWETSPLGTLITTWGVPSENNVYNIVDGKVVMREASLDASKKNAEFHNVAEAAGELWYWLCARQSALAKGNLKFDLELDPRVEDTLGAYDMYPRNAEKTGYLDPGWDICWGAYNLDWVWDTTALNTYTLSSDNPVYDINSYITDYMKQMWVKIVCADSEEEALAYLEEMKAELTNAGVEDLTAYRAEQFKSNLSHLSQDGIVFVNQK